MYRPFGRNAIRGGTDEHRKRARGAGDGFDLGDRAGGARSLAVAGAGVVVTGRDEQRGSDVVEEITAGGGEAVFVAHDLEDADPTRLVEGAEEAFEQGVDILVNNGGTLMAARLFLAGEETGYVQGVVLNVDGGLAIA